ncbi:MAG TPA: M28 family peptidase [Solirubrobacteraceae bacterium]|nr:M28 family peptidase [Solirubrobacteraceae bacterium]
MAAADTAAQLTAFTGRGAGTDAERRAAQWLATELRRGGRRSRLETFWCRPNWALAHAWHCLAAIAGSLVMASHPWPGGAIVLGSLLSVLADGLAGQSVGRRLTPERASQNVVSPAPPSRSADSPPAVRLIVTANYDTGRAGLAYRDALRAPAAALRRLAGNGALAPGWLGWLVIELVWLLAIAALRLSGAGGTGVGILQLIPTAALVVALALLLDLAAAPYGPGAGDNAAGAAVAVALARALDAASPRNLDVEVVLQGAGDGAMIGLRRYLRGHRQEVRREGTVVLGIAACGAGRPCWWVSDGSLIPVRYLGRLRAMALRVAARSATGAAPHRGRGVSPALPARLRGLPALTVGCVDSSGRVPRSHQRTDVPEALDGGAVDAALQFALTLVDELDAELSGVSGRSGAAAATA